MAVVAQAPIAAPSFAVVRRGYDPDQVSEQLNRISAETTILAADRAAAVEQATQLSQHLDSTRSELDAARTEIERLREELRALSGPPDSVASMNDRLQVMLRLARDEFGDMRATAAAQAAAHAAEIIAAVGSEAGTGAPRIDEAEWRGPQNEQELERMRWLAAEERTRLDTAAAARRAEADEEFRQVLTLRCREAMAQLARLQTEALRSARRVIDDADEQARSVLADAREAVRRTVDDAQRKVDDLHSLRERLASQLETSRKLLDRALPDPRAASTAQEPAATRQKPDDTPRTISGQRHTPPHLSVVAPAEQARHAAPRQAAPAAPGPVEAGAPHLPSIAQLAIPDLGNGMAPAQPAPPPADQPYSAPAAQSPQSPLSPELPQSPEPPQPVHLTAPAQTQPMTAAPPADTSQHAVPAEHPRYETPRVPPMRFPQADWTYQPGDKAVEAEPGSVPEPSKAPEAEQSQISAPNPYL